MDNKMDISTWISVITGIVSIVLAIVSIIISFVFYKWSDSSNKRMAEISQSITEKTDYLGKLFDKMIDTSFSLVKDESEAMRKHLFNAQTDVGSVSENKNTKILDVYAYIKQQNRTKEELLRHFSLLEGDLTSILQQLTENNLICKNDDETFSYKDNTNGIANS